MFRRDLQLAMQADGTCNDPDVDAANRKYADLLRRCIDDYLRRDETMFSHCLANVDEKYVKELIECLRRRPDVDVSVDEEADIYRLRLTKK
jgi:hypothetical protein